MRTAEFASRPPGWLIVGTSVGSYRLAAISANPIVTRTCRSLNLPSVAAFGGALSASKALRLVAGSTTISRSRPARCAGPIRAAVAVKKPRLTWVRIVFVASSKVV